MLCCYAGHGLQLVWLSGTTRLDWDSSISRIRNFCSGHPLLPNKACGMARLVTTLPFLYLWFDTINLWSWIPLSSSFECFCLQWLRNFFASRFTSRWCTGFLYEETSYAPCDSRLLGQFMTGLLGWSSIVVGLEGMLLCLITVVAYCWSPGTSFTKISALSLPDMLTSLGRVICANVISWIHNISTPGFSSGQGRGLVFYMWAVGYYSVFGSMC